MYWRSHRVVSSWIQSDRFIDINLQYGDGIIGAFIIDAPEKDPIAEEHHYDDEFVVLLHDWFHTDGKTIASTALHAPARVWQVNKLATVLFNGKGRSNCTNLPPRVCEGEAPLAHFVVKSGLKYRFRVICAATRVSLSFAVEGHSFTVVQSQGVDVVPIEHVKTLQMAIGSRYDVILQANQPSGNYHIAAEIIGMTFAENNPNVNIQPSLGLRAFAVLHYEGTVGFDLSVTNPFDSFAESSMPGKVIVFNDIVLLPRTQQGPPNIASNTWVINSTKTYAFWLFMRNHEIMVNIISQSSGNEMEVEWILVSSSNRSVDLPIGPRTTLSDRVAHLECSTT